MKENEKAQTHATVHVYCVLVSQVPMTREGAHLHKLIDDAGSLLGQ